MRPKILTIVLIAYSMLLSANVPWAAASPPPASTGEKRVALVVGDSAYRYVTPLGNPKNDAMLVADTLRALGFKLVGDGPQLDLDKAGIDRVVQQFGVALQGADVGLFYFAGHGMQVRGSNYLVPVDANPTREADIDFQMLDANLVLRQMAYSGTKLNIVLLDACRNNPFGGHGLRASNGGLAQMQAPEGTLISFATQPGNVALDGADDSPYSRALAEVMRRPGLDVFRAFNEVGLAVASATGGQQQPWLSLSPIKGDFYFSGPPASATDRRDREPDTGQTSCEKQVDDKAGKDEVLAANVDASVKACAQALEDHPDKPRLIELLQSAHEQQAFQRALRSKERGPSLAYLDLYGNGRFADDVRQYLASLTPAPSTAQGQANSPAEQNEMGDRYFYGRGVEQDYAKAMEWYRKAADRGLADAEYSVGVLYENGWGVTKDIDRAKGWYQKAADQGDGSARVRLQRLQANAAPAASASDENDPLVKECARLAATPDGKPWPIGSSGRLSASVDPAKAVPACQAALNAHPGDARVQYELARALGSGGSYAEIVPDLTRAADAGDAPAQSSLGELYYAGLGVKQDYAQSFARYQKAADQGDPFAQAGLGQQYAWGHGVPADHAQALAWFRKSADQGNAHGQNGLGRLYERGWAVDKDFTQALNWFHRAADQGYPLSQVNIGLMYQSGEGVSQDYAEAMAWFKKAADQGYLPAYLRIGLAYRDGRGVDRNYAEAAEWFKKAADQGYADAELELGWFYENGLGEDKNNDRAKVWYQKAADQGNSGAQAALQRLVASNAPTASTAETTPPAPNAEAQSDEWLGWGDFNNKFKLRVSLGYYPETSAARCESGVVDIRAHWVARPPGMGWYFFVLPEDKFNAKNSDLTGQGFALRYDDTFECAGRTLHQTLWTKSAPVESNSPSVNVATFPAPPLALTAQAPATTPAEENEQGDRYFYGRGVEQDYAKAMEWYRKAADRGFRRRTTQCWSALRKRLGCYEGYRPSESLVSEGRQ